MLQYPHIDPIAVDFGHWQLPLLGEVHLAVHWYGVMYLIGFVAFWLLGRYRAKRLGSDWLPHEVPDLLVYGVIGTLVGGRLGYALFYKPAVFLGDPLAVLQIWEGGMSFHGGLLGVIVAIWLYGYRTGRGFFAVSDFAAPLVPIGLGTGRIGNFINGELWGRPTELPWGMVFPHVDQLARHPSQLYQAFLEGVLLFAILWVFSSKPRPTAAVSGLFAILYGVFRFGVEFVRAPDPHLGFIAFGWLTMGQLLSLPMILLGVGLLWWAYRRPAVAPAA